MQLAANIDKKINRCMQMNILRCVLANRKKTYNSVGKYILVSVNKIKHD